MVSNTVLLAKLLAFQYPDSCFREIIHGGSAAADFFWTTVGYLENL